MIETPSSIRYGHTENASGPKHLGTLLEKPDGIGHVFDRVGSKNPVETLGWTKAIADEITHSAR